MRLFLAAALPRALVEEVGAIHGALAAKLAGWRFVRPEGMHLTLRFLGEVDDERDRATRAVWARVAARGAAFHARLGALGCFPPRGGPRVLWLGIEEVEPGSALAGLAASFEQAARDLGWPAEPRPFRPHLTLARIRLGARPIRPDTQPVRGEAVGRVRRVDLVASRLDPGGARYTALASFALGGEASAGATDEERM